MCAWKSSKKTPAIVNRRNVVLLCDIATLHSIWITPERLLNLGWSVIPHPPYSPHLASSEFHLFHFLQNAPIDKNFLKIRWKYLWKTFWAQKQQDFTGEESANYLINGKVSSKITANILLIKINALLNDLEIIFYWNGNYLTQSNILALKTLILQLNMKFF